MLASFHNGLVRQELSHVVLLGEGLNYSPPEAKSWGRGE